jgi:hypothetical protein
LSAKLASIASWFFVSNCKALAFEVLQALQYDLATPRIERLQEGNDFSREILVE